MIIQKVKILGYNVQTTMSQVECRAPPVMVIYIYAYIYMYTYLLSGSWILGIRMPPTVDGRNFAPVDK